MDSPDFIFPAHPPPQYLRYVRCCNWILRDFGDFYDSSWDLSEKLSEHLAIPPGFGQDAGRRRSASDDHPTLKRLTATAATVREITIDLAMSECHQVATVHEIR